MFSSYRDSCAFSISGNDVLKLFSTDSCTDMATGWLLVIETAPSRRIVIAVSVIGVIAC